MQQLANHPAVQTVLISELAFFLLAQGEVGKKKTRDITIFFLIAMHMLPLFYSSDVNETKEDVLLPEDSSRHVVQVLRMKKGEQIELTNGKGGLFAGIIVDDHKKKVWIKIQERKYKAQEGRRLTIAISILKNPNRFEWFLEKATEIGITEIIPMMCERTERQHFRFDRMQNILISAMIQSGQCWLPMLHPPSPFRKVVESAQQSQKLIAHCMQGERKNLSDLLNRSLEKIILIGPEGDFTNVEVEFALHHHFSPIMLGDTRLRAETAGIVAATLMQLAKGK